MHRLRRPSASTLNKGLAVVLAVSIGAAEARSASQGAPPPVVPALQEYEDSARDLVARIGEPGGDSLPGASDPIFQRYSNQAAALTGAFGTAALPARFETLQSVCGPAGRVVFGYALAGFNKQAAKAGASSASEQAGLMHRYMDSNLAKSFDQIFPVILFSTHCVLVHASILEPFLAGLPPQELTEIRRQGARQVRDGVFNTLAGALTVAADPGLDERRRAAMLEVIARDGTLAIPALPGEARAKLGDLLKSVPARGASRARIERIGAELRKEACGLVCSL